ncbi:unnamed protein product [Periconia digitata]|uniref:Uncharacterized protein n=1 Tax=Periconia digitata TaxID=1303443 RepID=A0A9W4UG03_9PLEO|nr:unnamed protein product [Periconia digitata]
MVRKCPLLPLSQQLFSPSLSLSLPPLKENKIKQNHPSHAARAVPSTPSRQHTQTRYPRSPSSLAPRNTTSTHHRHHRHHIFLSFSLSFLFTSPLRLSFFLTIILLHTPFPFPFPSTPLSFFITIVHARFIVSGLKSPLLLKLSLSLLELA